MCMNSNDIIYDLKEIVFKILLHINSITNIPCFKENEQCLFFGWFEALYFIQYVSHKSK